MFDIVRNIMILTTFPHPLKKERRNVISFSSNKYISLSSNSFIEIKLLSSLHLKILYDLECWLSISLPRPQVVLYKKVKQNDTLSVGVKTTCNPSNSTTYYRRDSGEVDVQFRFRYSATRVKTIFLTFGTNAMEANFG